MNGVVAKIGLPFLIEMLGGALSRIDNGVAQDASKALTEAQKALAGGLISPEAAAEANRHLERMAEMAQKEQAEALAEINASLRAEVASEDAYVRRMRPTFGYLMAATWTVQMTAIAYVIVFETQDAAVVITAAESLSAIWGIALSVLGIYVYKRSEEKRPVINITAPGTAAPVQTTVPVPQRKPFNR